MTSQEAALDQAFQALADPTRRRIFERLVKGPASVSDIAAPFDMSLPAVVHHLHALEANGLIRTEKRGRVRTCRIDPGALRSIERWVTARRVELEHRLERLEVWFADSKDTVARKTEA